MHKKISPTAILNNEQMTYYLITEDEALKEITETTKEVNEVLGLPSTTLVRLILNYFRWDKNTLMGIGFFFPEFLKSIEFFVLERFYEDPDKLFKTLNVANPNLSPSLQWNPLSPACVPMSDPMAGITSTPNNTCRT
jgi:hypothetical protein